MRRPSREGFTLIELLTVIAIIGILAAILIPTAMGVQRRAKQATSQTVLSGWCSGIIRYKQFYGFYPNIANAATYPTADTAYKLEASAAGGTTSVAANAFSPNLIMALSGKLPAGGALPGGATGPRAVLNRNSETFVEFSMQDYELPSAFAGLAANSASLGTSNYLIDRFGNRNIRVVIDFDGSGMIKSAAGAPTGGIPADIAGYSSATGCMARVIVYTSQSDVTSLDLPTQTAPNTLGKAQSDYLDVIAAQ